MDGPSVIVGIDGCPAGWVVAGERGAAVVGRLEVVRMDVGGVDMPIGRPESARRACDVGARRFLGPRGSTVFPAPPRACLGATDHGEATRAARAATGVGLSTQTFHLLRKVAELDELVDPATDRFVEVHPECAFLRLNDLEPLAPKRSSTGAAQREAVLARVFGTLPATPRGARRDDLLDAYAVLWSTDRYVRGEHVTFGDGSVDARGLPMRIVS